MRLATTLSIIAFFFAHFSIAQDTSSKDIEKKYTTYFQEPRETVHLHLNKTTFLKGEEVWWSAYVYDKKNGDLSKVTSNLYCGIYDANGKQILKKLFLVQNGRTNGSFEVNRKLPSGTYFIKAGTTWMNNFEEDLPFIQKITIINQPYDTATTASETYDLQILPEGGHLIDGIINSIGIRLTNQDGKGILIQQGEIINTTTQLPVVSFSNNTYGVGKFDLPAINQEAYVLRITLPNGKMIEKALPTAKEKGINLSINNILEDKLVIALKTNPSTLETIKGQKFYLAVHRDGLMTLNSFSFKEATKIINIAKNKLLSGTNIITLFNENLEPVCERLAFNYTNVNLGDVILEEPSHKIKDSISLKINVFSKNNTPASLSVTALPASTISYKPSNDIISNFLLQPYLKSQVENPGRYFRDITRKKKFELDLVLLTQGWSKYNWNTIFNDQPREFLYPFESGVTVKGKITSKIKKEEQLVIHQGDVRSVSFEQLQDDTEFNITNILIQNQDTIGFALKGKNGLRKPEVEVNFISSLDVIDSINLEQRSNASLRFKHLDTQKQIEIPRGFVSKKTIVLDEVIVEDEKIEKKLTRKSPLINETVFTAIKIDEEQINKSPLLTDLINKIGFRVVVNYGTGQIFIANTRPAAGPVLVYLDDYRLADTNQLFNVPLREIDEIYYERNGLAGEGFDSSGGVIRIYRKEGGSLRPLRPSFAEQLVSNSFSAPKEFYRPKYSSFLSKDFEDYGLLHWEPNLSTNDLGQTILKIPDNGIPKIKVFIEGVTEDGALISHVKEIVSQ